MSSLFSPLTLRGLTLRNRVGMSPMCMYSCAGQDGRATDWHFVHYPTRSVGGVGLVIVEASAVEPRGVISPTDLGIWSDDHVAGLSRVTELVHANGAACAIQLAHAGRKAGSFVDPVTKESRLDRVAPSPFTDHPDHDPPTALDDAGIAHTIDLFASAARRAINAGFKAIELHMAHGYLLHEFLSPLSNHRTDSYGGSFPARCKLPLAIVDAVRKLMPDSMPLFARISAVDPEEGGITIEDSVALARELKRYGVDLVDCSSGGITRKGWLRKGPGYQVPFAEAVKRGAGIATAAVGEITSPKQAEEIVASGRADVVLLARELLRNPYWALNAQRELTPEDYHWPTQYRSAIG
jgi:2,4-dienoyl-CoA reductase-like NADH-dependent reductase (Old Yellow Enzyme family)